MRTSLLAACVLLVGATAMAAPVQTAKPAAKPAPAKAAPAAPKAAHASGTVEKFDAATKTLTVKHEGKEMHFVVADSTSLMRGKDKIDAAALATSTGSIAKIEYMVSGTTMTADKIELSAAMAAKPAAAPKKK